MKKIAKKEYSNNKLKNNKDNMKLLNSSGITLIALVITIIVLLLLAGVSIAMLTGQNGILTQAQNAKTVTENKAAEEKLKLAITSVRSQTEDASLDLEKLKTEVTTNYGGQVNGTVFPLAVVIDGKSFMVDNVGNVELERAKLQIGDFVNYSAGNWTAADMTKIQNSGAKIAANNSTNLPSQNFQFGGFTEDSSRDGNATPDNSNYAYVIDKSTGSAVTGWRVFDIDGGTVTLISAGCPEDYHHSYINGSNYAYISEYILSGNANSGASSDLGLGSTYTARDWSMYINSNYGSRITATALTKEKLDNWYTKHITDGTVANISTDATFQEIYGTAYENLIDNYSYYWLASVSNSSQVWLMSPGGRYIRGSGNSYSFGVRILISLLDGIKTNEPIGTKTVTSRGNNYTYNVWNIK
ncbi:MAG: hypothetical protein EGQ16_05310 [Clostridiales bacterium]|nr:hypothetical protein [Clostridiales bacterium]